MKSRIAEVKTVKWLPRLPWPIWVGVTTNQKAATRAFNSMGAEDSGESLIGGSSATSNFYKDETGKLFAIVVFNADDMAHNTVPEIAGTVCHEAVHVWQEALVKMHEEKPGVECEAYAIQFITQFFLNQLNPTPVPPTKGRRHECKSRPNRSGNRKRAERKRA